MTIYYTLTFVLLVLEMFTFGVLVLPLPMRWRHIMIKAFTTSPVITKALQTLKVIFALTWSVDTFNRLQRQDEQAAAEEGHHHHDLGYETNLKATRFYAQRNLYLTGFTMFLSLILERTTALLVDMLQRDVQLQDMKKEASTATSYHLDQARLLEIDASYQKEIKELKDQIAALKQRAPDFDSLKKRASQQAAEYDQLLKERDALLQ
ncbi:B-cell receptor-associated protein 31-like-domain-containing protein [Dichotomocladium elegans]|nr:B-cell receptor-associated protein 31-like-domain-containing protein [Dichotomocladium elegans]